MPEEQLTRRMQVALFAIGLIIMLFFVGGRFASGLSVRLNALSDPG